MAAGYNHPLGMHEWDWISNNYGRLDHLDFWQEQLWWYQQVMGRYTSTAIHAITDSWYTLGRFRAVFVLMILGFCLAAFYFMRNFSATKSNAALLACGLIWVYFDGLTGVYDSVFRFSGILTYQLGVVMMLLFFGLLLSQCAQKTSWKTVLLLLLAAALPGVNEPCTFTSNWILLLILGFRFYHHERIDGWLQAVVMVFWAGTAVAILAPGNYVRMDHYGQETQWVKLFLTTAGLMGYQVSHWLANTLLVPMTLLAAPLLLTKTDAARNHAVMFRYPSLWVLGIVGALFLTFFPLLLGTHGKAYPERVVDVLFVFFSIGWWGFWQSMALRYPMQIAWPKAVSMLLFGYVVLQTWLGGSTINRDNKQASSKLEILQITAPAGQIAVDLASGRMHQYDAQMQAQYRTLDQHPSGQDTCWVDRPTITPPALYDRDSDRRQKAEGEPFMGSYWGKGVKVVKYLR
jgi:Family of unknown function (DUF6056)